MFHRAFVSLVPTFAALMLLVGGATDVAATTAGPATTAAEWNIGAAKSGLFKRAFREETEDTSPSAWSGEQDGSDDRVARVISIMSWPPLTTRGAFLPTTGVVLRTYAPCATPPRGPPMA